MFYQMTRLHWDDENFDELVSATESMRSQVESIEGLIFADLAKTGDGEGMIIAAYGSETEYHAASSAVESVIGQLDRLLTSTPHGHEGTVVVSIGNSPAS